jgi:hypothetical protein
VNASKYKEEREFLAFLISNHNSNFLEVSIWILRLEERKEALQECKSHQFRAQHVSFILCTVWPLAVSIAFVVGITGNGLLLTVFIRHKETRTFPKLCADESDCCGLLNAVYKGASGLFSRTLEMAIGCADM